VSGIELFGEADELWFWFFGCQVKSTISESHPNAEMEMKNVNKATQQTMSARSQFNGVLLQSASGVCQLGCA
jgi:alpha-tubulin suppressor-like RCC1 family protein